MLLDTQMWIYFHQDDPKLPDSVLQSIRALGPRIYLSVVSVWEAHMLFEKGRLTSDLSPREAIQQWLDRVPMTLIPLTLEDVFLSRTLAFTHQDPADRFIAATAYRLGAPLATDDRKLLDLRWLRTVA